VAAAKVNIETDLRFRHEALIYSDSAQFLAGTVPFVSTALEAGDPVLVAVSRRNTELLRGELGTAQDELSFVEVEDVGRNPARLIPLWKDFLARRQGRSPRVIGEAVWPGRDIAAISECQRHEALLDVAFGTGSSWFLLCPYDGAALPDEVLAAVSHSHLEVTNDGTSGSSSEYLAERDCYGGKLPPCPADADALAYDRSRLSTVRRRVRRAAEEAALAPQKATDLVVAASELAANSVAHGGGSGTMRTWREGDRLLIEFEDRGRIEEPLAGRVRPPAGQEGGRGLWLVNQLCDLVQIRSDVLGTTVRLQAAAV
jgi:anti-sigma regulatory factor (Ser/Thr protein kinase)